VTDRPDPRRGSRALLDATFRVLSLDIGVRSDLPLVARIVPFLLAPFRRAPAGPPDLVYELVHDGEAENPYSVRSAGSPLFRTATELGLIDEMIWHVNREAIGRVDDLLAIHAAAAEREGRGVVLPAAQDAGKSTLVAGLVGAGFGYLTDEAALIDRSGRIQRYAKPLWLSPSSVLAFDGLRDRVLEDYRRLDRIRTYVRPADLGGSIGAPAPVRLVVSPRFRPGHATTIEPMTRAATLMCLARNAFNLRERGSAGMLTLRGVVERAPGFRLTYSRLEEAVPLVERLLGEATQG
jgi:hypothetical protein